MTMDANPAYVEVTGDDGEYEIVEIPFRQPKTADVTVKILHMLINIYSAVFLFMKYVYNS